jgi:hypothetical protein
MFTMKHLKKVLPEIKGYQRKSVYSIRKSMLCCTLSEMPSRHRGTAIESIIRDHLITMGFRVDHLGGTHSFDMRVDGHRVEVKSSLAHSKISLKTRKVSYYYNFQNIKTNCFDYLILVFVQPKGLLIRMLTQEQAEYATRFSITGREGKSLRLDTGFHKIPGESFEKFWKENFVQVEA